MPRRDRDGRVRRPGPAGPVRQRPQRQVAVRRVDVHARAGRPAGDRRDRHAAAGRVLQVEGPLGVVLRHGAAVGERRVARVHVEGRPGGAADGAAADRIGARRAREVDALRRAVRGRGRGEASRERAAGRVDRGPVRRGDGSAGRRDRAGRDHDARAVRSRHVEHAEAGAGRVRPQVDARAGGRALVDRHAVERDRAARALDVDARAARVRDRGRPRHRRGAAADRVEESGAAVAARRDGGEGARARAVVLQRDRVGSARERRRRRTSRCRWWCRPGCAGCRHPRRSWGRTTPPRSSRSPRCPCVDGFVTVVVATPRVPEALFSRTPSAALPAETTCVRVAASPTPSRLSARPPAST